PRTRPWPCALPPPSASRSRRWSRAGPASGPTCWSRAMTAMPAQTAPSAACTRKISARPWASLRSGSTPPKAARSSGTASISSATPAPAVLRLVDAAIFNVLVGNADAHGKNYSLLHLDGAIDFAPLYDLLCTAAYPDVHAKLAMKVGKRSTLEEFTPDTWDDFAKEIGVGAPFVRRRAAAIAGLALERIGGVGKEIAAIGFGG